MPVWKQLVLFGVRGLWKTSKGTFPVGPSEQWHGGKRNSTEITREFQLLTKLFLLQTTEDKSREQVKGMTIEAYGSFSTMTIIFSVLLFRQEWCLDNGWWLLVKITFKKAQLCSRACCHSFNSFAEHCTNYWQSFLFVSCPVMKPMGICIYIQGDAFSFLSLL